MRFCVIVQKHDHITRSNFGQLARLAAEIRVVDRDLREEECRVGGSVAHRTQIVSLSSRPRTTMTSSGGMSA
jgi:hypothetical protein